MSLSQKQAQFAQAAASLIIHARHIGYDVTLGDAYRDPRLHGQVGVKQGYGAAKSCHKVRLALDLNIFKDGRFLQGAEAEAAHNELHDYWDDNGGSQRIASDMNHYSFAHEGMR